MIELGATYKDKITGFQGIATGYVKYLTGCNQALLTAKVSKDGSSAPTGWFDEQRVERVGKSVVALDNSKTPGFDVPAPIR